MFFIFNFSENKRDIHTFNIFQGQPEHVPKASSILPLFYYVFPVEKANDSDQ